MFLFHENFLNLSVTVNYNVDSTLESIYASTIKVVDTCGNLLRRIRDVLDSVGVFLVEFFKQLL